MSEKSTNAGGATILAKPDSPLIKISFFFSKLPHIPYDEFYKYWRETHGRLTVASRAFGTCNMQRYVQIKHAPELEKDLEKLGMTTMKEFKWDGCSELYVSKWQDYLDFASSEESAKVLGPDGAKIIDPKNGVRVTVSYADQLYHMYLKGKL